MLAGKIRICRDVNGIRTYKEVKEGLWEQCQTPFEIYMESGVDLSGDFDIRIDLDKELFKEEERMHEQNLKEEIMQFLYQNNIKSRTYSSGLDIENYFLVKCPFCDSDLKINYLNGGVCCRGCDCKGILTFKDLRPHLGSIYPQSFTNPEVRAMLAKSGIRWVFDTDRYITKCPRCGDHVGGNLTLRISPKMNLTHCTNCGYRKAFTAVMNQYQKDKIYRGAKMIGGWDEASSFAKEAFDHLNLHRDLLSKIAPLTLQSKPVSDKIYWKPLPVHRPFFEHLVGAERMEGIVSRPSMRYSHGGMVGGDMIKHKPLHHILVESDFSGAEMRMAAYMAKVGAKAGDSLRKMAEAMSKIKFDKYLRGDWIMLDSLSGVDQKISVACAAAFNPNEMADMVTREHPFMYTLGVKPEKKKEAIRPLPHLSYKENQKRIQRSKSDIERHERNNPPKKDTFDYHNQCVYVFIHESLIHKANHLGIEVNNLDATNGKDFTQASCGNYYVKLDGVHGGAVARLKKFFKTIHSAKWGDKRKIDIQVKYEDF